MKAQNHIKKVKPVKCLPSTSTTGIACVPTNGV